MTNADLKALCVDDEAEILDVYAAAIKLAGLTPIICSDPKVARQRFFDEMSEIAIVISDLRMPSMTGFELRASILPDGLAVPFVIVSSYITKEMALEALDLKIDGFIDKPVQEDGIAEIIQKFAKRRIESIRESRMLEAVFLEEAAGIIDELEAVLLALEQERNDTKQINLIFRAIHTIKGSSGVLSSDIVTRYVHKYEDIISAVKKGQLPLSDSVYAVFLKGYDRIKELLAAVGNKTIKSYKLDVLLKDFDLDQAASKSVALPKPGASPTGPAASAQKGKDSISVPIETLEKLSGSSGEITVLRNMVRKLVKSIEQHHPDNKDVGNLGDLLDEMHKVNGTIQNHITDLRKAPLSAVLKPIPRIVRDLSKDLGKLITLKIEGEKTRVDNLLATVCNNCLVHLVRNSADHGIEDPETRKAAGKPESGTIVISCREQGEEVHITITDDGRGVDPERIRNKAIENGLYTAAQLAGMNTKQIMNIIFASGFSTAAKVTDVSGRGVGMDMVKTSVEAVGGSIVIESELGKGSAFILKLPVPKSILIIRALIIEARAQVFAVPQDAIVRVLRIEPSQVAESIQLASFGRVLRQGERIYPLLALNDVLSLPMREKEVQQASWDVANGWLDVLILQSEQLQYALLVDSIQDAEEIVVKPIMASLNPKRAFAGATFLDDGSVGLILDIGGVARIGGLVSAQTQHEVRAQTESTSAANSESVPTRSYLLFKLGHKEIFGVPLSQVFRLEELEGSKVQRSGAERVVIYRDALMPLYSFDRLFSLGQQAKPREAAKLGRIPTIVARSHEGYFGLEVESVVDIVETAEPISPAIRSHRGIVGNFFIRNFNVTVLDLDKVLHKSVPA